MSALSVLIADDHPVFRDGIRALLEATPGTTVVGEATTGEEAVSLAATRQPDLILMDVQMPGLKRHRGHPADCFFPPRYTDTDGDDV